MSFLTAFNVLEGIWWLIVACVIFLHPIGKERFGLVGRSWLSSWFVLFGISDFIEISTGAWWRPTSLLVLKGICLAAILGYVAVWVWRSMKR